MTDTTWTSSTTHAAPRAGIQKHSVTAMLGRFWRVRVIAPLHRALDSALRAGELGALSGQTLSDIGYRRG